MTANRALPGLQECAHSLGGERSHTMKTPLPGRRGARIIFTHIDLLSWDCTPVESVERARGILPNVGFPLTLPAGGQGLCVGISGQVRVYLNSELLQLRHRSPSGGLFLQLAAYCAVIQAEQGI